MESFKIINFKTDIMAIKIVRLHVGKARKKWARILKFDNDSHSIRFSFSPWKNNIHHKICIHLENHYISSPKVYCFYHYRFYF